MPLRGSDGEHMETSHEEGGGEEMSVGGEAVVVTEASRGGQLTISPPVER